MLLRKVLPNNRQLRQDAELLQHASHSKAAAGDIHARDTIKLIIQSTEPNSKPHLLHQRGHAAGVLGLRDGVEQLADFRHVDRLHIKPKLCTARNTSQVIAQRAADVKECTDGGW